MSYCEIVVLSAFDNIMIYLLITNIIGNWFFYDAKPKRNDKTKKSTNRLAYSPLSQRGLMASTFVYVFIATLISASVFYFLKAPALSMLTNLSLIIILLLVTTKAKLSDTVVTVLFCFMMFYLISILRALLLTSWLKTQMPFFFVGLISQFISLIIIVALVKSSILKKVHAYTVLDNSVGRIAIINLFLLVLFIAFYFLYNQAAFFSMIFFFVFSLLIIISINTAFVFFTLKEDRNRRQTTIVKSFSPIIENAIEEIRSKQHDYHNHLATLLTILEETPTSQTLQNYIAELKKQDDDTRLMKISNRVLIALLHSKKTHAKKLDIDIHYKIATFDFQPEISDFNLVEIFSVLIDNAIDATLKNNAKSIEVHLSQSAGEYRITITNTAKGITSNQIAAMFEKGYTTKPKKQGGIGLYKAKQLATKHRGTLTAEYLNNEEKVTFILDLP